MAAEPLLGVPLMRGTRTEQPTTLREARSLTELGAVAIELGLGDALLQPIATLLEQHRFPEPIRRTLRTLGESGFCTTLQDLVTPSIERLLNADARPQVQTALTALLERAVPARRAAMTGSELRTWAEERGVVSCLDASAGELIDLLTDAERAAIARTGRPTVGELAASDSEDRRELLKTWPGIAGKARRWLDEQAADAEEALAEERARAQMAPPTDPLLRLLWDRLASARVAVREHAIPRSAAALPEIARTFEREPPVLSYREPSTRSQRREQGRVVTVPLIPADDGRLLTTCTCSDETPARCTHVLAALDDAMASLVLPASTSFARALAQAAASAPWQRALEELDSLLAVVPVPDATGVIPEGPLGWRLQTGQARLRLVPYLETRTRAGVPGRGTDLEIADLRLRPELAQSAADREVRSLLLDGDSEWRYGDSGDQPAWIVHRALAQLIGHPRVQLGGRGVRTLEIREARLALNAHDLPEGGVQLTPALDGDAIGPVRWADLVSRIAGGWLVIVDEDEGTCRVAKADDRIVEVCAVLSRRGGVFPAESLAALSDRIPVLAALAPLDLPPALRGQEVPAEPRLVLRLTPELGDLRVEARVRVLAGAPSHPIGEGPVEVGASRDGKRVFARRDRRGEAAWARPRLTGLPLGDLTSPSFAWLLREEEPQLDLVAELTLRAADIDVEWPAGSAARRVTRTAMPSDLRVEVKDRRDWFGISGGLEVDGVKVPLAALLDAIRRGRRYVAVEGNAWVKIADELRERLQHAADVIFEVKGALELSAVSAPAFAALAESGVSLLAPARWQELQTRARAAGDLAPPPPAALTATLRDYQLVGYHWLTRLAAWGVGGCLADDMGLGKTVQALAVMIDRAALGPQLVVAPTSVCWNWIREAERFAPSLRPIHYREDRTVAASLGPGDVLVASYGLVTRDIDELKSTRFATLVLDEAHALKNPATARARAAAELDAGFRIALTGTPLENRLGELWSLFRTVAPGLLGSWEQFRERFAMPIERDGDAERQAALARLVRPFLLRRLKSEVARELPARTEIQVDVELSPAERALYDGARLAAVAQLGKSLPGVRAEQGRFQVLAALTRLRQLACHPRLYDETSDAPSSKIEVLLELVEELRSEGHRALIFSQFTSFLALVRAALDAAGIAYLYLDGATPEAKRRELVDAFQAGEGDLFLISLKAGGMGLNLTGADNVIHLDPWWNPAVEDQATDRAHRIGQTRPVTVYRLVARNTIEDSILTLHAEKRALVASVLEGTGAAGAMTTNDLLALLASP